MLCAHGMHLSQRRCPWLKTYGLAGLLLQLLPLEKQSSLIWFRCITLVGFEISEMRSHHSSPVALGHVVAEHAVSNDDSDEELSDYDSPLVIAQPVQASPHRLGRVHQIIAAQPAVDAMREDALAVRESMRHAYRAALVILYDC